jgi:pimeloyl-ACP methyl ester carboxylesterase
MPAPADFQAMRDAYDAAAPDPAHFDEFAARTSAMVHEFPGWTDELRSLQLPTLLIFGDRDFSPLPDVVEMFELLPDAAAAWTSYAVIRPSPRSSTRLKPPNRQQVGRPPPPRRLARC